MPLSETLILHPDLPRACRLGFGCWQLGGHGWQEVDTKAIQRAVHEALDNGINFFDTADIYGLGQSERLLGEAVKHSAHKHDAIIASKFGVRVGLQGTYYDNSSLWLEEAVNASLKRLNREAIDLYQLHWHDGVTPLEEVAGQLERLYKNGKVRSYGMCNITQEQRANLPQSEHFVSFSAEYSLVNTASAQPENLAFIAWGALAQGLLSGKYSRLSEFAENDVRVREGSLFQGKKFETIEPLLQLLKKAASAHGKTMAQTALRFVLDSVPQSLVLAGIKNTEQLHDNAGVLGWHLHADWLKSLIKASADCQQRLHAL